jgi:torso-like protein
VSAKLGPKDPKLEPEEIVEQEVEKVKVGDAASVSEFVRSYGSHYIASYVTGNSLYQVVVISCVGVGPWIALRGVNKNKMISLEKR